MLKISGIILTFNRPSEINGMPIGTLLQVGSNNQKTGYSLQTIYFPIIKPTDAIKIGAAPKLQKNEPAQIDSISPPPEKKNKPYRIKC